MRYSLSAFLSVLALALLPVGGNIFGAFLSEVSRTPKWVVGAALHAAAGVAIALVTIDLAPRIIDTTPTWLFLTLFAAGALLSYFFARVAVRLTRSLKGGSSGAWMVYMATSADLLSDGLMTGASAAVSAELGLLLALSQVVANIPGGFATIGNFKGQGIARRTRYIAAASFVAPVIIGVSIGYVGLKDASEAAQNAALAVIVGILLVTTVEDLVPEADKPGASRPISTTAFVGGFAFFALLAAYLA